MLPRYFLVLALFVVGCKTPTLPAHSQGHWGDRSSWHDESYIQTYYADSDGHEIGHIYKDSYSESVDAVCRFNSGPGEFETAEDAQNAVETKCALEF